MKALKVIIAILVICLVIILCYKTFGNKPTTENVENEIANTEEIDIVNEVENNLENEVVNETIEENIVEVENVTAKDNAYESNSDVGSTNKKEEAISLVKEKWGEDNSASFRCDSVRSDGTYIIAVIKDGEVKNYFKVNLDTKTVEVDY